MLTDIEGTQRLNDQALAHLLDFTTRPEHKDRKRVLRPFDTGWRSRATERYGAVTTVPDWSKRLVCGQCGSRNVNMVVSGT